MTLIAVGILYFESEAFRRALTRVQYFFCLHEFEKSAWHRFNSMSLLPGTQVAVGNLHFYVWFQSEYIGPIFSLQESVNFLI